MASHGLSPDWRCIFANDIDPGKSISYRANNDAGPFRLADVNSLTLQDLPGAADLAWASFPCQDLSLAGNGAGLIGKRSGTFWPFWNLIKGLASEGRGPAIVALENVYGAITSRRGKDLAAIADAFADLGYQLSCCVIDAVHFLPQSRPRLFVIGVRGDVLIPNDLRRSAPSEQWQPMALMRSIEKFGTSARRSLFYPNLPNPAQRNLRLEDIVDAEPKGVEWHEPNQTRHILSLMDENNAAKVRARKRLGTPCVGTVYRRTRPDENGGKAQRAEVRFDGVAGCLRTPGGGSSRQILLIVEQRRVRSRLLSPREVARLMGLPEQYILPEQYNEAYRLAGDGVVVPVVKYLSESFFLPLLAANRISAVAA